MLEKRTPKSHLVCALFYVLVRVARSVGTGTETYCVVETNPRI